MAGKTALVTGGLGGLGRHLCKRIMENGWKLRILAHESRRYAGWFPSDAITWGDVRDAGTYAHLLEEVDAVVHMAFVLPPTSEVQPWAWDVNVGGTRALVEALEELNPTCRLVFPSTVLVYGVTRDEEPPVRVDHPLAPTCNYADHKVQCEELIRRSKLRNWTILRVAAGIYLELQPSVGNLARLYEIPLDTRVEFVHPKDVATAMFHALDADCTRETFNVGGGPRCQTLFREQVEKLLKVFHLRVPPERKFSTEPYPLDWYDTSLAQEVLQFQERDFNDHVADVKQVLGWKRRLYWLASPFSRLVVNFFIPGYKPLERCPPRPPFGNGQRQI
ncbi:MAG: NAD(P)-dependent oxidoreductase [Promethearchaeota archaeon]